MSKISLEIISLSLYPLVGKKRATRALNQVVQFVFNERRKIKRSCAICGMQKAVLSKTIG